jgi:hypothetical protein
MIIIAALVLTFGGKPMKAPPIDPRFDTVSVSCVCTDRGSACVCPNGECQCDDCPTRTPSTPRPASNGRRGSCKVGIPSNSINSAEDGERQEGDPVWCKRLETSEGVVRNVWLYPGGKWARPYEPARHDLFQKQTFASAVEVKTFRGRGNCPGGVCPQ